MKIEKSYSNDGQDVFVNTILPIQEGFFLDIGCNYPKIDNNTYALEVLGWTGLLIDINPNLINQCKEIRKSSSFLLDCSQINWREFLKENNVPKVIDYISLDVDDANVDVIRNFPFDEYEFKIMTFETDFYKCGSLRKDAAIKVLSNYSFYEMCLEDGILHWGNEEFGNNLIWEDWWINTKYINLPKELYSKKKKWKEFNSELQDYFSKI